MNAPLQRKLALTVVALSAYQLCFYVLLPTVTPSARQMLEHAQDIHLSGLSILALGITPFVSGYFLVEIFSLVFGPGRRVRAGGLEGRRKLNRWALHLSLVLAVLQAFGMTLAFERPRAAGSVPMLDGATASQFVTVASLVAGSASAYLLCRLITEIGFGNGFCLLLIADFVFAFSVGWFRPNNSISHMSESTPFHLLATAVALLIFVHLFRRADTYEVSDGSGLTSDMKLPSLPQSLVPVTWTLAILNEVPVVVGLWSGTDTALRLRTFLLGLVVLVPLLSFLAVHLFSTKRRVEANVPAALVPEGFEATLSKRLKKTTAILTVLAAAGAALGTYNTSSFAITSGYLFDVVQIAVIAAVGTDLFEEWKFRTRHPSSARLVQLDNVHLAIYLRAVFREQGIDSLAQALHFRSLFFFFNPLYKITILVPVDCLEMARERLEGLDVRIY